MSSKPTIFLRDNNQVVNLDGMEFTVDELKQAVIDQAWYKGRLTELLGGK